MRDASSPRGEIPVSSASWKKPSRPAEGPRSRRWRSSGSRSAEWAELNLEDAEWNIPAAKMKMREPHLVPLARQAIAIFQELQPLTGWGRYVFPSARTAERPMSDAAINAALRRMGYLSTDITSHGFRAMARTMLDEVLGVAPHLIEHQLAHAVKDPLGRAYNRTKHLPDRRDMMQRWADYLDQLKSQNTARCPASVRT